MKNSKYKSFIILGGYFLIGTIILCISNLTNNIPKTVDPYEEFKNMTNYSYEVINNNEVLKCTVNNKITINYNNKVYDNYNIDINPILLITNKEFIDLINESNLKETGYDELDKLQFNTYITNIDDNEVLVKVYNDQKNIKKIIIYLDNNKVLYNYNIGE